LKCLKGAESSLKAALIYIFTSLYITGTFNGFSGFLKKSLDQEVLYNIIIDIYRLLQIKKK